jgi:hypothetical protein
MFSPLRAAERSLPLRTTVSSARTVPIAVTRRVGHEIVRRVRRASYDVVDRPVRLIQVPPGRIQRYQRACPATDRDHEEVFPEDLELLNEGKGAFRRRRNVGRVLGGDWDRHTGPFEELGIYRMLEHVFEEGGDWGETAYFRKGLRNMARGYDFYHHSTEEEFRRNRLPFLEGLYERIDEDGYLLQRECPEGLRTEDVYHEISANVDRDGGLIFNNRSGNHRLSMAKLLDVETVPVLVVVRHRRCQAVREEVRRSDSRAALSDRALEHLAHPDVRYLADDDWP